MTKTEQGGPVTPYVDREATTLLEEWREDILRMVTEEDRTPEEAAEVLAACLDLDQFVATEVVTRALAGL